MNTLQQCAVLVAKAPFSFRGSFKSARDVRVRAGDKFWVMSPSQRNATGYVDIARRGRNLAYTFSTQQIETFFAVEEESSNA
jgi:hypothetical protein